MDNEFLNSHKWGGSGIERCLFEFILNKFEKGSTIIEIGAGYCSTGAFSTQYDTYSIEHDSKYIGVYPAAKYIHAPLKNGWYDRDIVESKLPKKYQLIFIDGPPGEGNRNGILSNLDIFDSNATFIFHDTYRLPEQLLAEEVAKRLNKNIKLYDNGDYWAVVE